MDLKLSNVLSENSMDKIKNLYFSAFPGNEQKPFSLILKKSEEGFVDIIKIETESEEFIGEAIMIICGDVALLDYFAISPGFRGKGLGSEALKKLRDKYRDKKFILEIESTKISSSNIEQRLKRKKFYLSNGMVSMDYNVDLIGVEMEILTFGDIVDFDEYHSVFERVFGPEFAKKVRLVYNKKQAEK